jgi:hypothetical protein
MQSSPARPPRAVDISVGGPRELALAGVSATRYMIWGAEHGVRRARPAPALTLRSQ